MNNITLNKNVTTHSIIPIDDSRFSADFNFNITMKLGVGSTFDYTDQNNIYKYRIDRVENGIWMFSREYTVGPKKGYRVFHFGTILNTNYPILIPYSKLDEWIRPYRESGKTTQTVTPYMYGEPHNDE